MKKILLPLLFVVSLVVTSCDFTGESNYTPSIFFMQQPVTNNRDTLNVEFTGEQGLFLLDTIRVGDTVHFALRLEAYANHITAFGLKHTPDSAAGILLPPASQLDSIFNSSSDYDKGDFYLDPTYNRLFMVFKYVALKPTNEARIEMTAISDAKFDGGGYGSAYAVVKLKTPIKP